MVEDGNKLSGALGQAARESDGLENVLGNLKQAFNNLMVEFGTPLLGIATEGIKLLSQALQSITIDNITDKFKELTGSFGAIGESSGIVKETFERIKEAFSEGLGVVLDFAKGQLSQLVTFWDENGKQITEAVKNALSLILNIFNTIFPAVLVVVKFIWNAITDVIQGSLGVIQGVIKVFSGIFTGDFSKLWEGIKQVFTSGIKLVLGLLNLSFVGAIRNIFVNLAKTLLTSVTRNWTSIIGVIRSFSSGIVNIVRSFVSGVVNFFTNLANQGIKNFNTLRTFGASIFSSLRQSIMSTVQSLVRNFITATGNLRQQVSAIFTNLVSSIIKTVSSLPGRFLNLGKEMMNGLINGIKSLNPITIISNLAGNMISKFKEKMKIFSPSRVFKEFGLNIVQGLANGIRDNSSLAISQVTSLGDSIIKSGTEVTKAVTKVNTATRKEAQKETKAINTELLADRKQLTKDLNKAVSELEKKAAVQDKASAEKIAKAKADAQRRISNASKKQVAKVTAEENRKIAELEKSELKKKLERNTKLNADIAKLNKKAVSDRIKLNENAAKAIAKVESGLAADRLKALQDYAELQVNEGNFSTIEEAKYWEAAIKTFAKGSTEYLKAQKEYATATKSLNDEVTKANKDYINETNRVNKELKTALDELSKTYDDEYEKVYKSYNNAFGLFEELKFDEVAGQDLINNLSDQVQALTTYVAEFDKISNRGLSSGLIDELKQLGVDALPQLIALNNLTDEELKKYSDIYEERSRIARERTELEMVGMKKDTEKQIKELTESANAELLVLQNEWLANIKEITQGTANELTTLEQIGKNGAKSLLDGLATLTGPLQEQAKAIGETLSAALKEGLGIDLGILNPFKGVSLTSSTPLNNVVSGANSIVAARNSVNQGTQEITASPVLLDGKKIGEIVYTVTNGIQNSKFAVSQTLKGATN